MADLPWTYEICGTLLSKSIGNDVDILTESPNNYISERLNVDLGDIDVEIVKNGAHYMHLALPYYSGIERATVSKLSDDELDSIAGGEIVISLAVVCAVAVPPTVVGVSVAAGARALEGKNLDGSPK